MIYFPNKTAFFFISTLHIDNLFYSIFKMFFCGQISTYHRYCELFHYCVVRQSARCVITAKTPVNQSVWIKRIPLYVAVMIQLFLRCLSVHHEYGVGIQPSNTVCLVIFYLVLILGNALQQLNRSYTCSVYCN